MKRLLVSGATGFLGRNLVAALDGRFEIVATVHRQALDGERCATVVMDVTDAAGVRAGMEAVRPDAVVHCAAEARVDYCEDHRAEALRINVDGARHVAAAAAAVGAKMVYISTDSVFDGRGGAYDEAAVPNPVNVYAESKLLGERAVQAQAPDALVVRTNFFGWSAGSKPSLAEWFLERIERGEAAPGFVDVYFSPMLTNDLADVLAEMIAANLQGVFHVGASERWSKYEFGTALCAAFGKSADLVRPTTVDEGRLRARRPKDTSLDVGKVTRALGRRMPGIGEGLARFHRLRGEGYVDRLHAGRGKARPSHV